MGKRAKVERETPEYAGMLRRMIRSYGRRVAAADIEDLGEMATVASELEKAIQLAVDGLLEAGYSWTDVGRPFGLTRQGAQQRWGRRRKSPAVKTAV